MFKETNDKINADLQGRNQVVQGMEHKIFRSSPEGSAIGQLGAERHVNQPTHEVMSHPLFPHLVAAIEQAIYGKGVRHGGGETPFLDQPIFHYMRMHGRGFATGQAAKKLEEAASTRHGEAFRTEVLGAIVYAGAALIKEANTPQPGPEPAPAPARVRAPVGGAVGYQREN